MDVSSLAERIDAVLPQTQCTRCGYADCRAYAEALAAGETDLNRCPPGGTPVIETLAALLQRPARALDPDCGPADLAPAVAWIREAECIGCYKCVRACPVDAIVGAPKHLHAVIDEGCNGCELCLPACPVDCIEMRPAAAGTPPARARADAWRQRYLARRRRLAEREAERERRRAALAREARIQRFLAAAHRRAEPSSS